MILGVISKLYIKPLKIKQYNHKKIVIICLVDKKIKILDNPDYAFLRFERGSSS